VVEWIKESGAIAVLAFGLILGNGAEISRMFRVEEVLEIDKLIKEFETGITFFVRTFFFVYPLFARKIASKITAIKSNYAKDEVFLS